ncbi:MAG: thiamine phosphate synthase [Erythrobacter sp.]
MALRYSATVRGSTVLPANWLVSDARNDARLEAALERLPRGSGFIYRHYHLPGPERLARFLALRRIARARGHVVILADSALTGAEWGADGIYAAPRALWPRREGLLHLATAHDLGEIGLANRLGADAVLLSPVYPTRSHPGAKTLGPVRFRLLAARSRVPVIALGGMDERGAQRLRWPRWAAIDGLTRAPRPAARGLTGSRRGFMVRSHQEANPWPAAR